MDKMLLVSWVKQLLVSQSIIQYRLHTHLHAFTSHWWINFCDKRFMSSNWKTYQ